MSRDVYYVAHPVTGDPLGNCEKAKAWLKLLIEADPNRAYIMPWVAEVEAMHMVEDAALYERALIDDEEVASRCTGIILTGGKVTRGMLRELLACLKPDVSGTPGKAIDLTKFGDAPEKNSEQHGQVIKSLMSQLNV